MPEEKIDPAPQDAAPPSTTPDAPATPAEPAAPAPVTTALVPLTDAIEAVGKVPGFNLLARALAKAQGAFKVPRRTATATIRHRDGGGSHSYDYAPLDEILNAVKDALSANGIAVIQDVRMTPQQIILNTILLHESGQAWKSGDIIMANHADPKVQGGYITYARRYSIGLTLNISAAEDKDAQGMDDHDQRPPRERQQARQPASMAEGRRREAQQAARPAAAKAPAKAAEGDAPAAADGARVINADEQKRMFDIAKVHGVKIKALNDHLKASGISSPAAIKRDEYDTIIAWIQTGGPAAPAAEGEAEKK
jgi:hypothetical protein